MIRSITINNELTLVANATTAFSLEEVQGLEAPPYRTTIIEYAGKDGGMVPDQKRGQRIVTITGGIDTNTPEAQLEARRVFLDALSFNENVPISIVTQDNKTYLFYAKFRQPQMPIKAMNSTDFQIIAIADDWRLYDSTSGSINSATVFKMIEGGARWRTGADGDGWRWLTGSGVRWNAGSGSVNVVNTGTTASNPVITITGANQNPIVRNVTTGEQIKINITTGLSDVLVIDTLTKSVLLNGGNINALVEPGSTYFSLQPGGNLITLTNDNVSGGQATIQWYDAITGV